jgi:hypothetical protein
MTKKSDGKPKRLTVKKQAVKTGGGGAKRRRKGPVGRDVFRERRRPIERDVNRTRLRERIRYREKESRSTPD